MVDDQIVRYFSGQIKADVQSDFHEDAITYFISREIVSRLYHDSQSNPRTKRRHNDITDWSQNWCSNSCHTSSSRNDSMHR